jgi:uncharacterized protein YgiM (DUF1202 family)
MKRILHLIIVGVILISMLGGCCQNPKPVFTPPDTTSAGGFVLEESKPVVTVTAKKPKKQLPVSLIQSECDEIYTSALPNYGYKCVRETVYATAGVNVRVGPGLDFEKIGRLKFGDTIIRTGIGEDGWDRVLYNGETAYMVNKYLSLEKPVAYYKANYPLSYSDGSCSITVYREWWDGDGNSEKKSSGAWCYAAHIVFSDYSRFGTSCANGSYDNGYETTTHAAKRLGAILAVNGCYSAPYLNYTVVRSGVLCNGGDRNCYSPGIYSSNTGLFTVGSGGLVSDMVANGTLTDTFCFGPEFLVGGVPSKSSDTSRAQRTFIGTSGKPGDIWIVVSDGRYNDGESAGLTYGQCARYLVSKGCTFGIPLDGGGSSTMVFKGIALNANRNNLRAVVDFVYFK